MKKILALALVVVMTMAMSVPAFAADLTTNPTEGLGEGAHNIPITIQRDSDNDGIPDQDDETPTIPDVVIAVDIGWSDMTFTYVAGGTKYDPATMTETVIAAGWKDETKTVTVSNRSNVDVTAGFSYGYDTEAWESLGSMTSEGFSVNFAQGETMDNTGASFAADSATLTLAKATLGTVEGETVTPGTPTKGTVNITRTGDWVPGDGSVTTALKVGSVRIIIAKVEEQPAYTTVDSIALDSTYKTFYVKKNVVLPITATNGTNIMYVSSWMSDIGSGVSFDKDNQTITFTETGTHNMTFDVTTDLSYTGDPEQEAPITAEFSATIIVVE